MLPVFLGSWEGGSELWRAVGVDRALGSDSCYQMIAAFRTAFWVITYGVYTRLLLTNFAESDAVFYVKMDSHACCTYSFFDTDQFAGFTIVVVKITRRSFDLEMSFKKWAR